MLRLFGFVDASPRAFADRCAYGAKGLRFKISIYHAVEDRNYWIERVRNTKGVNIEFETLPFGWHPSLSIPDLDQNMRLIVLVDPTSRPHMARHEDTERVLVVEVDRNRNEQAWKDQVRPWILAHVSKLIP